MIKKVSKFLLLFLSLFGIIFSNIPFYAVSSAFNAYVKSYNIVDKAWHLQKDSNVVDKFASFRNLTEELKIKETYAATSGAVYPTLGVTVAESPWLDNNWTNPTNVYSDDAATAYVIAASFDSPDQTYVLKATGFDFSAIPDGSTINGVTARVNAWYRSGQGSGAMDLCQLLDINKAKVGTNQCATQVALTTNNTTIITKGSASDKWGNALDTAWIKDPDFGIAIGIKATAANADVDVDYVTLEIDYTPPADSAPPDPDPMTFSAAPNNTSATQIDMTASTATDATTPPVSYYFALDTFACAAANIGSGAADSGWQSGTTYSDTGLSVNKCYGYRVKARDSVSPTPNGTGYSGITTLYTSANTPSAPTVGSPTENSLVITNNENGNPTANPTTEFAVRVTTADGNWNGKWVDGSGNASTSAVWLSDVTLTNLTVNGLRASTQYDFEVKARNNDGDETSLSTVGSGTTSAPAAPDATSYVNGTESGLNNLGGRIGQQITISGTNLAGGGSVTAKDTCTAGASNGCVRIANYTVPAANITTWNDTTIVFTIPSGITVYGGSGTTCGGADGNGICVTQNGNNDTGGALEFWVYPDITSTTPSSATGAKEGDSITISGTRFGSAGGTLVFQNCAGGDVDATPTGGNWTDTSLTVTAPSGIADDDDSCDIKITRAAGTGSKDDSLIGFTILPKITAITNCDSSGFPSGAYGREYDAGDTPCPNTLTDGAIIINGNHFGSSGSVTILGQTASQFAIAAFCGGGAYSATCIAVRVPDTIGNGAGGAGDYVGDIVLTRSGKSDTLSGFRVLPRITGFTPGSAAISESVTVDGNHFCQNGGSCPLDFDTMDNYVIFNSNATATSFVSWNNTAMATAVPTGASTGNVFLRSNGYNSNAESFTVNVPTPANPSNLWQSRNYAFTNLIATGGVASSTPVYLSATTSSGVGGGTMYMQVEARPTLGANKDFSSPSACSSVACTGLNPYCFENAGASYPTGGVSLTATSSITLTDEYYHWQTRARYNKSGTDYCSAWQCYPDSGCNSEVATDFEIDTVAPVISSASSTPSTNGATISWDTIGDLSTTQVEYGTDSGLSGSTFTAITDTPPETNGKTAGHSVALSNLNSNTTYYYRARSKDSGNLEGTSSILNFITDNVTEGPSKTTSFHIVGATGLIAGGSTATTTFAVSMPETASTTKSAFVEITGVYSSGASSKDIAVQVNSQTARTYVVPASTTSFFKFIYQVSLVNPSNTLYVTPQANTTVYITSAKLIVNYAYTP